MTSPVDEALNDCIDRMQAGETAEQCLADHPAHAAELRPLLGMGGALMGVASGASPREEARRRTRYAFNAAVAERLRAPSRRPFSLWESLRGWRSKLAAATAVGFGAVILFGATAFGAVVASENAVPGDTLYAVKTAKEDVLLNLPQSDMSRAKRHAHYANVRTMEVANLINAGKLERAQQHIVTVTYHLDSSARIVGVTIIDNINPIEMPARAAPKSERQRMAELVAFHERDMKPARSEFRLYLSGLSEQRQRAAYYMLQRWEMMNRIYIQSLLYDGPALWPVWIDVGSQPAR